jgi:hypothetical protein
MEPDCRARAVAFSAGGDGGGVFEHGERGKSPQ